MASSQVWKVDAPLQVGQLYRKCTGSRGNSWLFFDRNAKSSIGKYSKLRQRHRELCLVLVGFALLVLLCLVMMMALQLAMVELAGQPVARPRVTFASLTLPYSRFSWRLESMVTATRSRL